MILSVFYLVASPPKGGFNHWAENPRMFLWFVTVSYKNLLNRYTRVFLLRLGEFNAKRVLSICHWTVLTKSWRGLRSLRSQYFDRAFVPTASSAGKVLLVHRTIPIKSWSSKNEPGPRGLSTLVYPPCSYLWENCFSLLCLHTTTLCSFCQVDI